MNRHQILSGACNAGDRCYAVGSVEGIPFTAYAAGCNIVILASTFERVQIIPGAVHGYIKISALDCSTDTGKIAAAYDDKICIFEPTPLIHTDSPSTHNLEYKEWVETGSLQTSSNVTSLSWNLEGTRLLTGGTTLQMWREKISVVDDNEPPVVKFEIGGDRDPKTPTNEKDDDIAWECIWNCQTATRVHHMSFSPDGTLFATSGKNDRLVKIWYENKPVLFPTKSFDSSQFRSGTFDDGELNFGFVYIAHPRAVTQISWRKTSKYMPKGSVSNMLVTSCLDNICRIWIETVLPDDGLVNMNQFDPLATQNPKFRTHRHKHRFMQRLKHMKTCFHIRRHAKNGAIVGSVTPGFAGLGVDGSIGNSPIPSLPSTYSVHDFHSYGYHGTGVSPGVHFHLAASINAETDIPLVPSMQTTDASNQPNFILHWLNNKEMNFTLQAEAILQELTKKTIDKEDLHNHVVNGTHHNLEEQDEHSDEQQQRKKLNKQQKSFSHEESNSEEHSSKHSTHGGHSGMPNVNSMSNTTSSNSLAPDNPLGHVTDSLDVKIDCLLRDWHHSPDLLFAIHPVDGSYLIWIIEWLDDYYPGSFRQAQVSFSTRIPSAFPLGDAMSMSTTVALYNTGCSPLFFREMVKGAKKQTAPTSQENNLDSQVPLPSVVEEQDDESLNAQSAQGDAASNVESTTEKKETSAEIAQKANQTADVLSAQPSPTISMVTKHANGTLNLWQLTFADKTKFTQVLSIGHVCRASGHRFRVNDITCHPVLPLLLTTSHHNIPDNASKAVEQSVNRDICGPTGFCSELILWRVDSVGPLSHSGGVSELARINSPEISAFSNVAWIPTLLPSTTLGSYSNSPSACFVASDGECLRVYQAVIDARTLLAEVSCSERISRKASSLASISTECSSDNPLHKFTLHDKIKIVSQQSTARPGCIVQLDAIEDATHDWQNTQFLHVFQEQLITGEKSEIRSSSGLTESVNAAGLMESHLGAMVDLQRSAEFEEPFYIVIIERTTKGSTIHMWRIVISSKSQSPYLSESAMYVPDSNIVQDLEEPETGTRQSVSGLNLLEPNDLEIEAPHVSIVTKKVCMQELPLPDGVDVVHASPAAGHLSSASIYPACFAPYIIVTACSDSTTRFWNCNITSNLDENCHIRLSYEWSEWNMLSKNQDSAIEVSGQPLNISAAYSGRIACAYKYGKSFTRPHKGDPDSRYVNLCVAIYECESTGGSEWVLEDTIHLKNVHLPRIQIDPNLDLSYLHDHRFLQKKQRLNQVIQTFTHEDNRSPRSGEITPELMPKSTGLLAVPSFSTLQSLRKSITENGNTCPLTQKHLVQLDWVSKEDGSHILTVAVGSKILLYTPVSSDLAQANMKAMKESQTANRPILRKASSLAQPHFNDEIRWMKLRQIDLQTADGLPPLPMQISWVRDGILVVGMDSEMHVYSQWKARISQIHNIEDMMDNRNLRDEDLRSLVHEASNRRLVNVASMPHLSRVSSVNLQILNSEKKKKSSAQLSNNSGSGQDVVDYEYMTDYGLFQASRIACPVLPQYHPKQLMELLNSGKIRWVKAILAHLVRCMSGTYNIQGNTGDDDSASKQRAWSRSRTLSVSYAGATSSPTEKRGSTSQIPEELTLDYAEITSIPPLPLWVLLTADKEGSGQVATEKGENDGYNELFDGNTDNEASLDDYLDSDSEHRRCDRRPSVPERQSIAHFGPRQGQLLSRLLTHTHLPGLSSLDQMHLLALADTVATCNTDFSERFAIDAAKRAIAKENLSGTNEAAESVATDSLDDCGLRFLLAMKHYNYLLRCLPLNQRNTFQKQGVATSNLVWAFHSESEEELLNLIPSYSKGTVKWATLKELGVGWWLRSKTLLKQCVEKLAKAAYQVKQDPLDAAIYYLAMRKKNIVRGLFKSKRDDKMTTFFSNNFEEPRWRTAALKNAFVLLGKQRFDHSVAFFLLANSLKDAIQVCLNNLDDFQLALVITRLYEGGEHDLTPPTYKQLLYEHILGCDMEGINQDLSKAHPDPFLRSIALWQLSNYSGSLNTLLENNVGLNHQAYNDEEALSKGDSGNSTNPNVFNFYIYLRTHPLLIRQQIATTAQEKKQPQVVLAGFSYNGEVSGNDDDDKQLQVDDAITPLERQLYFTTAHGHFKAGCPALALEVLSKLPSKVIETFTNNEVIVPSERDKDVQINTGILDWGTPAVKDGGSANDFDWGKSVVEATADSFDWSAPVTDAIKDEEFKIEWDEEDNKYDEEDDEEDGGLSFKTKKEEEIDIAKDEKKSKNEGPKRAQEKLDIMAQQLKFVACLKILMEELSTLATGFEVDGGQLRYQLYIWLEREVIALKQLCNYSSKEIDAAEDSNTNIEMNPIEKDIILRPERPTLHEILLQENQDFEAKVKRAAKRKRWLKANETLLRTLLSYCSLHGASGGGLASVRMELVLLLQELQQEKTQQQLASPLPFPTTLPLLSACVAGNKTVIADPIRYLQSQTQDMLQTTIGFRTTPIGLKENSNEIYILRDLAIALSSCIYQSLCDSETFVGTNSIENTGYQSPGIENLAKLNASFQCSHLMVNANIYNRRRKYSMDEPPSIITPAQKWPGVTNLRALLAREKDEDTPRLNVLLLESFVATYMALLVYALATCDCHILYRLVGHDFTSSSWALLFGGGTKKLLRKATCENHLHKTLQSANTSQDNGETSEGGMWSAMTSMTKHRVKLNMKILGQFANPSSANQMKEDKPTYREQFVPPEMSMVSYFLIKPSYGGPCEEDYDSDNSEYSEVEEEEEEDVFADPTSTDQKTSAYTKRKDNIEHSNQNSYSWTILRSATVKLVQQKMQEFINVAGIELQELPVASPLAHGILRILSQWQEILIDELYVKGPAPHNFIPGCFAESDAKGPAIHKYRSLLERHNTPFLGSSSAGPARRLWNYLVRQEHVQDIFIRAVFGKKRQLPSEMNSNTSSDAHATEDLSLFENGENSTSHNNPDPIRVIHKEQESISAFCINNVTPGLIAIATPREIQEMDISLLLESPHWYEDECEYDILNLSKDSDTLPTSSFLVIQTSTDKHILNQITSNAQNYNPSVTPQSGMGSQSGRGTSMVLKHRMDNVKRMCAHPLMPVYITGGQDGSVQLWEWGHQQVVCTPRPPGTFAKVTRCRFSQHGNKFGIADGDGNLSLWQAGIASQSNRSFFNYQCHNKGIADFVFLGSCSLVATAGHSSENKNVGIWDTLLPQKKSLVASFTCHDQGASSLIYAPQHQVLISAGKKGDVCIFDVRQRTLRQRLQAHESSVKCLAIDPHEEIFVTGSADGDIKVWSLTNSYRPIHSYMGEHARSSFFKHIGQGVSQLHIDSHGRLFSCGSDGSMKVRQLSDMVVQTL